MTVAPSETLRVLLVAEQEGIRDQVAAALRAHDGDHRLYWVSQPELAVTRAQDALPHVILVDDGVHGPGLTGVVRQLLAQTPGAAVLALLDENAMGEARQAVLAGARGFVTKPLDAEDFWTTLHQVLAQRPPAGRERADGRPTGGRVVVFCGPKGGTGRTTMTVNSAIALHQATRKPVVLVDADFSAPALDVVLNLHDDRDISDLLARIARIDEELVARVLATHGSGVRVLLAPPPATLVEPATVPQMEQILGQLKRMFDWVFVDQGLPLDDGAFAMLDAADRIVLSVLPEMVGLRNTRLMLDQMHARGYPDERVWIVLNRATINGGVSKKDIEQRLHVRVRHTIPDDQPLVSHSVNRGVPLIVSHKRSAVARAMQELAQLLLQDSVTPQTHTSQPPQPTQANPFLRMRGRSRTGGGS
jgi:pilus assembly protein CpaE